MDDSWTIGMIEKGFNVGALKAPFPWYGGKSRVASTVWKYFGDVRNYVEPFAGSLAVLLGRPSEPKIETVNDLDCWIANFWRALRNDPENLAKWADWPVNEADLHARHIWLVNQAEFRERMKTDPDWFDVKIAGWWVWGISQWIGSGWCRVSGTRGVHGSVVQKRPYLTGHGGGMGVHRKIPNLRGNSGAAGSGIHASGLWKQRPQVGGNDAGRGVHRPNAGLLDWFYSLADRLRRVRVCCGDWRRVMGPSPTTCIGVTGVFLDPPYSVDDRADVYNEESRNVSHDVREWAIQNGDNPMLRIALCGYSGEHDMPEEWTEVAWKSSGGYGSQGNGQGNKNRDRERIWFSRHCLGGNRQMELGLWNVQRA